MLESQDFAAKSRFWSKVAILVEVEILVKSQDFQNSRFGQYFGQNIKIQVKKIKISVKSQDFGKELRFW